MYMYCIILLWLKLFKLNWYICTTLYAVTNTILLLPHTFQLCRIYPCISHLFTNHDTKYHLPMSIFITDWICSNKPLQVRFAHLYMLSFASKYAQEGGQKFVLFKWKKLPQQKIKQTPTSLSQCRRYIMRAKSWSLD